jgi:hypothetical protein
MFVSGRRLLAALLLVGCSVALGQLPAQAAGTQTNTKSARDVFVGTVTHAHTSGGTKTYDVEVDRVYKGDIKTPTVQITVDTSGNTCGLDSLSTGRDYVFFTHMSGSGLTTKGCYGTAEASGALVHKVERLLGDGRPAVPPAPEKAVFTKVAHAKPTSLPRLAAPGAAMVLAGLLGLIVVRRLGRRA